jgi:hypothetical protein
MGIESFSPGGKAAEAEVKKTWIYTFTHPYTFME